MFTRYRRKNGVVLIEVIICTSILALVIMATASSIVLFLKAQTNHTERLQAAYLLEEAAEAVRYMRAVGWASEISSLAVTTPYYLSFIIGSGWEATTSPTLIDGVFKRTVTFSEVYRRDSDDDIVALTYGGAKTLDPNTRLITFSILWGSTSTTTISYTEGIINENLAGFPSNSAGDGDPAQSFTVGSADVDVVSVDLLLTRQPLAVPSDVFLEIRSGSVTGTVMASSSIIVANAIPENVLTWTSFSFASTTALLADETYFLRLRSIPDSTEVFSGSSGYIYWGHGTNLSPYAGGVAYRYVGRLSQPSDAGEALTLYDFSFRINEETEAHRLEAQTYLTNFLEP